MRTPHPAIAETLCYAHVPHSPYLTTRMPKLWRCEGLCGFGIGVVISELVLFDNNLFFIYFIVNVDMKEIESPF